MKYKLKKKKIISETQTNLHIAQGRKETIESKEKEMEDKSIKDMKI